jgi:signal transduction histidine kinase
MPRAPEVRPMTLWMQGLLALLLATAGGIVLGWVWTQAGRDWASHLDRAAQAGTALFTTLATPGVPAPAGLRVTALPAGAAPPYPPAAQPMRETRLSILTTAEIAPPETGAATMPETTPRDPTAHGAARLALVISGPQQTLPVAGLDQGSAHPAQRLGQITTTLARNCSDAVLYARSDGGPWLRIDGEGIWSCTAVPPDRRLSITLATLGALAMMLGLLANQHAALARLIAAMTDRFAGLDRPVPVEGPAELRALAESATALVMREREQLAERAQMLAGISHDLGTPTTRMRLRAALITDPDVRANFERDIEQMSDMIEAVLIHTREQMAQEAPVPVSVLSLLQSVADDFTDTGASVELIEPSPRATPEGATMFSGNLQAGRKAARLPASDQRMLALCRPKALRRAISNLVENALKYGRRARIEIDADAETLTIRVCDFGGGALAASAISDLVAPFARGPNAAHTPGSGMGLAIVDGIARQHGGALRHDDSREGIIASLTIRRNL